MIGKNFIFNGNAIPYTTAEGRAAGWLLDLEWTGVTVRNNLIPRQDFHGVISHPTLAEGRLVVCRGEIFGTLKSDRGTIRKEIQDMFLIQDFPTTENEFKVLSFEDDDGVGWFLRAKVYSLPEFTHLRGEPIINVFFQLLAEDPLIRSIDVQSETGSYGLIGGLALPAALPDALDGALNSFVVENEGNFSSPAKLIITVQTDINGDQNIAQQQDDMDSMQAFGTSSADESFGFMFTAATDKMGAVTIPLGKTGAPIDAVRVSVYTEAAGVPDIFVGTTTVDASDLTVAAAFADLDLITIPLQLDLTIGNDYIVFIERTGSFDVANYYNFGRYAVDNASGVERVAGVWSSWANQLWYRIHEQNSIVNPKVYNLTTGKFFGITTTVRPGETLEIDADAVTAELDGVNVLASRISGSNWIFLSPGNNAILLTGDNFDWSNQDKAQLEVEYYHTRM